VITFQELKELQPLLGELEEKAITIGESTLSPGERNHMWYHDLKQQMFNLVGCGSTIEALTPSSVYDACYHHLAFDILGL